MKTGTRISYLSLVLVTLLMSIMTQVVAAVLLAIPTNIVVSVQAVLQGITDEVILQQMAQDMNSRLVPVTIVVTHLLLLITFGFWYHYNCNKSGEIFSEKLKYKEIFTIKNIWVMVLIAAGMCFLVNFAMPVAALIIPGEILSAYEEMMESAGFGQSLLPTLTAVLIAPFGEEFVFRGVAFYYAKKAVSDLPDRRKAFWLANCIQALGFGFFHMNLVQGTYAFVMGLALGYLAHRFRTLLPAMLGHMMINALSSFAWAPVVSLLPESNLAYGIGALVCLMIVLTGLYLGGPAEPEKSKLKKS